MEKKMHIVAFWSKKGGTGKTASSIATFDYLTMKGFRTLFIDLDEQCNASLFFGLANESDNISAVFDNKGIRQAIHKTPRGSVIPADEELSDYVVGSADVLSKALEDIQADYDFVILDCPPSTSEIVANALFSADRIVIPCQADESSLQGLGKLSSLILPKLNALRLSQKRPVLKIEGLLLTQYNARSRYTQAFEKLLNQMATMLNTKVFNARIRQCVALNEAKTNRESIFKYAPESNAALDYTAFAEELLKEFI